MVLPFVSVLAYIAGAAAAAAAFDRPDRQGRRRLVDTVAAVIVTLAGAAAVLALAGEGRAAGPRTPLVVGVVAAAALSMGAQATAVRRTGGVAVLTTASTGAITSLGVELGRHRGQLDPAARATPRGWRPSSWPTSGARRRAPRSACTRRWDRSCCWCRAWRSACCWWRSCERDPAQSP